MNFGKVEYVLSQNLEKNVIRYKSTNAPGNSFLFRKTSISKTDHFLSYWLCTDCEKCKDKLPKSKLRGRITVQNDTIISDPEIGHHPECNPRSDAEIEALILAREMKLECKRGRKHPLQQYTESQAEITKRFRADPDVQDEVENNFKSYKSYRRSLSRLAEKTRVPIDDPKVIPEEYQSTLRGREAEAGTRYYNERWLLYSAPVDQPMVHVFCSNLDLETIHESQVLIMDGTFKAAPKEVKQLYTIHAFGKYGNEAIPVSHVLLENKKKRSYIEVLTQLRLQLETVYGNIGQLHTVLIDFEKGAFKALKQVFPELVIKGCNFHFGQAMHRRLKDDHHGKRALENPLVKDWVGSIRALSILPPPLIEFAWEDILGEPPIAEDDRDYQTLQEFVNYVKNYWIGEREFPIVMWNHWSNSGPRTSNHAEGYHNLVNSSDCNAIHLSMKNFLHWLQTAHNRTQVHIRKLNRGIDTPTERDPLYVKLHEEIMNAKREFYDRTGYLWDHADFSFQRLVNERRQDTIDFLHDEILAFLKYIQHRIGKKIVVAANAAAALVDDD